MFRRFHVFFVLLLSFTAVSAFAHDGGDHGPSLSSVEIQGGLGDASEALIQKPIGLEVKDHGIKWMTLLESEKVRALANQGIAYLHVFHYVDALRSFLTAYELAPESLFIRAGLILAYQNLDAVGSLPFVLELVNSDISSQASQKGRAWFDFATARYFVLPGVQTELKKKRIQIPTGVLSFNEAFQYLEFVDPYDTEFLTLAVWLGGIRELGPYLRALELQPRHIGAHHYIIHALERQGRSSEAEKHSEFLAAAADFNPHAIHMHGHILPEVGQWLKAIEFFEKAHDVHLEWAERNGAAPYEDWHYAHNLHLMGVTRVGVGDLEGARQNLSEGCEFDLRSCVDLFHLNLLLQAPEQTQKEIGEFEKEIVEFMNDNPRYAPNLEGALAEVRLLQGKPVDLAEAGKFANPQFLIVLKILIELQAGEDIGISQAELERILPQVIEDFFPQRGFDSWTKGVFYSLRWLQQARKIPDSELDTLIETEIKKKMPQLSF